MNSESRRTFFKSTVALSALAAGSAITQAQAAGNSTVNAGSAFDLQCKPVPLPFDSKSLHGLSEKLLQSHWEHNYIGSVNALNTVRTRLAQALAASDAPAYVYNDLKREHLMRTGSVVLHELYFANLGGDGKAGTVARSNIADSFGSFDRWEAEFRKIGSGLGGGSGWAILGYNPGLGVLENYWMGDHATGPVGTVPLLVMDMYEHSYAMDYGAAAAKYIDAFFANIQWDAVGRRMERAGMRA
jgi:Fe-Mn family superoxide dismutase